MKSCFENMLQLGILYVILGMYCVECMCASVIYFILSTLVYLTKK